MLVVSLREHTVKCLQKKTAGGGRVMCAVGREDKQAQTQAHAHDVKRRPRHVRWVGGEIKEEATPGRLDGAGADRGCVCVCV